jgi:alanine racemase
MGFFRPTRAEIDLGALKHNFEVVKKHLPKGVGVLAMVKADAYGHGAVRCARLLEKCGAAAFGVATVEEGLELRESNIKSPIIVMGGLMGMGSPARA